MFSAMGTTAKKTYVEKTPTIENHVFLYQSMTFKGRSWYTGQKYIILRSHQKKKKKTFVKKTKKTLETLRAPQKEKKCNTNSNLTKTMFIFQGLFKSGKPQRRRRQTPFSCRFPERRVWHGKGPRTIVGHLLSRIFRMRVVSCWFDDLFMMFLSAFYTVSSDFLVFSKGKS